MAAAMAAAAYQREAGCQPQRCIAYRKRRPRRSLNAPAHRRKLAKRPRWRLTAALAHTMQWRHASKL